VVHGNARYELLGQTKDDAVGEAFDKVAKLLGLGYPGGPVIDQLSEDGEARNVPLPRTSTQQAFDFSFSGLKTAVYYCVTQRTNLPERRTLGSSSLPHAAIPKTPDVLERQQIADIAASFQEAAVGILVTKTLRACQRTGITQIVVGGGVASNRRLRARMGEEAAAKRLRVVFPPPALCVDNGAMVAGIAYPLLEQGKVAALSLTADPSLCLVPVG
jgi:N6-L-threonylcarbamoyladenine synthase